MVRNLNTNFFIFKNILFAAIHLAQKMSPEKRADLLEAMGNLVDRDDKSVSPSPSNGSEGEGSP